MAEMKPASPLPFTVVEQGKFAYLYPVSPFDAGKRAGMPLRCVALRQRQTGAKRGQSPRLCGFDPEEMQDLRYLAHAANAHQRLVAALRKVLETSAIHRACISKNGFDETPVESDARALLRELGEVE